MKKIFITIIILLTLSVSSLFSQQLEELFEKGSDLVREEAYAEAMETYQNIKKLTEELDKAAYARAIIGQAFVNIKQKNLVEAERLLHISDTLIQYHSIQDTIVKIEFFRASGSQAIYLNRTQEAIRLYSEGLSLAQKKFASPHYLIAAFYANLELSYAFSNQHDNAISFYNKGMEEYDKLPNKSIYLKEIVLAKNNMGLSYYLQSDLKQAKNIFSESLSLLKANNLKKSTSAYLDALLNLTKINTELKEYSDAKKCAEVILELTDSISPHYQFGAYMTLTQLYGAIGDLANTKICLEQCELLFERLGANPSHKQYAAYYNNYLLLNIQLKNHEEILKNIPIIEGFANSIKQDTYRYFHLIDHFTTVYINVDSLDKAILYNDECLEIVNNWSQPKDVGLIVNTIGNTRQIYVKNKDIMKGEQLIINAIEKIEAIEKGDYYKIQAKGQLVTFYLETAQPLKALELLQEIYQLLDADYKPQNFYSFPNIKKIEAYYYDRDAIALMAIGLLELYKKDNNLTYLEEGLKALEMVRERSEYLKIDMLNSESKYSFNEILGLYDNYELEILFQLYEATGNADLLSKILNTFDRRKTEVLQSQLALKNYSKLDAPQYVVDSLNFLAHDMKIYAYNLKSGQDITQTTKLRSELLSKQLAYENLVKRTRINYPKYHEMVFGTYDLDIQQIQSSITNDVAIINYSYFNNKLYTLFIDKENVVIRQKEVDLKPLMDKLKKSITNDSWENIALYSKQLYNNLLKDIESNIDKKEKLVFIGDGILHTLPYEVLVSNDEHSYLVRKHQILTHYSMKLYMQRLNQKSIKNTKNGIKIFSPTFYGETSSTTIKQVPLDSLSKLNYAEIEAKKVEAIFERNNESVELFMNMKASEKNFKALDKQKNHIIHLATHSDGQLDEDTEPWIAFTNTTTMEEDGILYLNELIDLNLDANLVFSNSCLSGVGNLKTGEGIIALPRGFIYGNTDNIIYSLFSVKDSEFTVSFIEDYYKNLLEKNMTYSEALQQAQIKAIEEEVPEIYWIRTMIGCF